MRDERAPWFERLLEDEICELRRLLISKNNDYGSSAFQRPALAPDMEPETAILVRIGDKIERLRTIAKSTRLNVTGERFEDTMRDLAGYIILYFIAQHSKEGENGRI